MKKILLIALVAISTSALGQAYMDDIVDKSCQCISSLPEDLNQDNLNLEFGLCILQAAQSYEKKLKKDYDIDLEKIDGEVGQEFGRLIGLKMASKCPDLLLAITNRVKESEQQVTEEVEASVRSVEGEIVNVEDDQFVAITVKGSNGKTYKYYWLQYVDSDIDVSAGYDGLVGKNVSIGFTTKEFFDPKIKEYRLFNVISTLSIN
ncbi:MAG: hypothetical protein AAFX87_04815 [Bacteroidota bacterium]